VTLTAALAGCATVGGVIAGSGGGATVTPVRGGSALEFNARSAVYAAADANTIDLYLTDLSTAQIDALLGRAEPGTDPDTRGGQIVHIHLFLWPEAGRSPIDFDASNATLTHAVLTDLGPAPANAPGALEPRTVAIYSGGGFVLPGGLFSEAGDDWLTGTIRNGTVRYRAGTDTSADPLGISSYHATFRARLDPRAAAEIEALLSALDALAQSRPANATGP